MMKSQEKIKIASSPVALSSHAVSKVFPVFDPRNAWQIILGINPKQYITALSDISLIVPKGKIVGVIGHNGSGKSTLLRILSGNYRPTSGSVLRNGNLSGLFELGGLGNPYLTGIDYARRVLTIQGIKRSKIKYHLEEIREFSELGSFFDQQIHTYSSGMASRLYFATATSVDHEIYLIDEILSVGDEHFQNKCWLRMRDKLTSGASGVLVTHDITAIIKLCKEAYILDRGKVKQFGSSVDMVRNYCGLSDERFKEGAKFIGDLPLNLSAKSKEDFELVFTVEIKQAIPVVLNYSIEFLRTGVGWELLLCEDCLPIATAPGIYTVSLAIQKLPLAPGCYELSISLSSSIEITDTKLSIHEVLDALGWCTDRRCQLIVEGNPSSSHLSIPLTWKKLEITD